jgi:hypothetical protein
VGILPSILMHEVLYRHFMLKSQTCLKAMGIIILLGRILQKKHGLCYKGMSPNILGYLKIAQ